MSKRLAGGVSRCDLSQGHLHVNRGYWEPRNSLQVSNERSPKVEERSGHSPQGPCWVGHVDLACWMAAGLGFPPAALTKKWFGEEQSDCIYPQASAPVPGLCAQCPVQSLGSVDFAQWLFVESMEKALPTCPLHF